MVSIGIFWVAYQRIYEPEQIKGLELLLIALLGLIVNLIVALVLSSHHDEETKDANVQSALYHVLGDAASSVGVIAAAFIIWQTGWILADPLVSILIGLIIAASSWKVIKSSAHIMMEGTPICFSLRDIEENMIRSPRVAEVHDLHIWNICSHHAVLTAHVVIADQSLITAYEVMDELKCGLRDDFGIEHTTLQMEYKCCERDSICVTCDS
jgi:cobalt-zinc-cadmium efflux system protein